MFLVEYGKRLYCGSHRVHRRIVGPSRVEKKYILGSLWGKNHHFLVSGRPGCDETTFIKTSTTHQVDQNVTKGVGSLKLGGGNNNSEKIFL